jgi:acetyl-CoA C-acetyltransferase/acetyl-CoA acyltransferase
MRKPLYIVGGARTPFCKFNTLFKDEPAYSLGASAVKAALADTGVKTTDVDSVIFGCVAQPADAMNIARVVAYRAGLEAEIPAVTVHRNCGSGMEAITQAIEKANTGKGDIFIAGGTESMSLSPTLFPKSFSRKLMNLGKQKTIFGKLHAASKFRLSDFSPEIGLKLGLTDPLCDMNMGQTAELLAREIGITRLQQDAFSVHSHDKAIYAKDKLSEEIAPMYTTNDDCIRTYTGKYVDCDNGPRNDSTIGAIGKLRPIFDRSGTVTAANSSQITDGAAALVLMTEEGLSKTGLKPIAEIHEYAYTGCDPKRMGLGPVSAIKKLQVNIQAADLVEINEAFAAQTIACKHVIEREIGLLPDEKLNVNGGAIALGHPVGASGARITLTLAKELARRGEGLNGVAALCIGGGQGGALWIKT